jgi:hypothetical protein
MKYFLLRACLLVTIAPVLHADELAFTKEETALPVANKVITSPDGTGKIQLLPIENLRHEDPTDIIPAHRALLFTSGALTPYVAYASEMGNLSNTGAWAGSSYFAIVFTGLHSTQEMAIVYPEAGALKGQKIDWAPVFDFGAKQLPWDERALMHDAIIEIRSGEGDTVVGLYWRNASGKNLAVPVFMKMKDRGKPQEIAFEFGEPRLLDREAARPTLADFGIK